jgi:small-conductance mechanosensitive channel
MITRIRRGKAVTDPEHRTADRISPVTRWLVALALIFSLAAPVGAQDAAPPASAPAPAAAPGVAPPPPPPAPAATRLDQAKAALDAITKALAAESLSDADLAQLRAQVDPIAATVEGVAAEVAPKQAAVKATLQQLGPPPDAAANPQAPPEDPKVTQDRNDQLKLQANYDDLSKRAKLLQVQAEQVSAQIGERRRALFANRVFQPAASVLSPALWVAVAQETPRVLESAREIGAEFLRQLRYELSGGKALLGAGLAALILLGAAGGVLVVRRVLPREKPHREMNDLRLGVAALWSGLAVMAPPLAATGALYALAVWLGVSDPQLRRFALALIGVAVRLSVTAGMIAAILAPFRPFWRPIDLSDRVARRLARLIFAAMIVVSLGRIAEVLAETAGASLAVSVAARGLYALLVGLMLARGLYGIVAGPEAKGAAAGGKPANIVDESPLWAPIRFGAWLVTFAIIAAALIGYVSLSAFLVHQMAWVALVGGLLFLLLKFSEGGLAQAFRPNSRISRSLTATLGVGRESLQQVGVLLSGLATVALFAVAIVMVLLPWGVQSNDMIGAARSLFFGVQIGDVTISLSSAVFALTLFAVGYGLTGAVRNWLQNRYLPLTHLDQGLRDAISASIGYLGLALSLSLALSYLGISLEKLALVISALSVGIGLGLQGVVANFVSGLVILWERAIRVGDLVVVGGETGYVRRINIRSTEIQTFDRAVTIVPNGNMITGVVKNFVRSDRTGRVVIPVEATGDTDPELVRQVLIDTAKAHDEVVGFPSPFALLVGFGAMLAFELYCYVEDVDRAGRVKSDLHFAILRAFKDAGIKMVPPAPPPPLDAAALDQLVRALSALKATEN